MGLSSPPPGDGDASAAARFYHRGTLTYTRGKLGVPNVTIGVILGALPAGAPDPFMLGTLPFIVLCLVALGYGERLGYWLRGALGPLLGRRWRIESRQRPDF